MIACALLILSALPAPNYEDSLSEAAEARVDHLLTKNRAKRAQTFIKNFRLHVTDDARLKYEHGLTLRLLGENEPAETLFLSALIQDPSLAQAWYDLGEVQLLLHKKSDAHDAFEMAAKLSETHPNGWAAPFRLAELAGKAGEIAAFESWLEKAIQRGFSFENTVLGNPTWGAFLQNPDLADTLRRLITVYGSESILDSWQAP
jgi:tetratricopeptide (TPR) repeat protein